MDDFPRLIEHGFPLRETSLASVHEKNVRHGHISTLHIWPARRPLAACRAALIATLLPDPGDSKRRADIFKRLAGTIPEDATSAKEIVGGVLRWGNESGPDLEWFRKEIRRAYDGRAPRVLDPFAGGGAIPLEAMRLGCQTTAIDINPVAWFVLKCTLEYPQRFAGKTHPLPGFAKGDGFNQQFDGVGGEHGDLAAHVRAWGQRVLERASADLARYYPTIDGKPTVAYLWARTVRCKNCRATMPLLKTRWLCKTDRKASALVIRVNVDRSGVEFDVVQLDKAQRTLFDASGTMNRAGARCPCCPAQMTMEELRAEGQAGRMGTVMTAVVVDGSHGKEYRLPTAEERTLVEEAALTLGGIFSEIPFGLLDETIPPGASRNSGGSPFTVVLYGIRSWRDLFTPRQLLSFGTFAKYMRDSRITMAEDGYSAEWIEAISAYLCCVFDKMLDYGNTCCSWYTQNEQITHLFNRFALPIKWDYAETSPIGGASGSWRSMISSCLKSIAVGMQALKADDAPPEIIRQSAIQAQSSQYDVIITDPPYYDAIPYSDLMDIFHIWLRRNLHGLSQAFDEAFAEPYSPKWNRQTNDGELIDDSSRFDGDRQSSKQAYEDGMFRAFQSADRALAKSGRMVVVFAHKDPNAWETLVSAMIRAGFVVDASWPIATEMANRTRAMESAALASSIWLICKKRPSDAKPGWDEQVKEQMRANIAVKLREYWDAGIRGPDFVWSAIGPALEAYSSYPRVKKVDSPDELMTVSEFLADVRREVVGFAAARVLHSSDDTESDLDGLTTYYLLHRHDFRLESVPVGASILYAVSCNLRDTALVDEYDLLERPGRSKKALAADQGDAEPDSETDTDDSKADKSAVRLKAWDARLRPSLGEDSGGRAAPLIDQIHRLMRLWKSGDLEKVNDYIAQRSFTSDNRAREVIQAIIEFALPATEERSILEAVSNHLGDTRAQREAAPALF
jgi:adenine-specific DNA methylase